MGIYSWVQAQLLLADVFATRSCAGDGRVTGETRAVCRWFNLSLEDNAVRAVALGRADVDQVGAHGHLRAVYHKRGFQAVYGLLL